MISMLMTAIKNSGEWRGASSERVKPVARCPLSASWRIARCPGFTLIELLVVLAILVLLMGLLFVPMFQTLSAVNRAQAFSRAQDALNVALQQIVRDMEEAVYIYPPPVLGYPSPHDAQVLARLDMILPEISGSGQIAYPPQRSNRIVRYFVAPLPDQATLFPDRLMWAANPPLTPPETRLGYLNPFVRTFADLAQSNMVTLYRVEFSRDDFRDPSTGQLIPDAVMNDPYFYINDQLVSYLGQPAKPLGQIFKDLSHAMTPQPSTDLAIYYYDPKSDSYQPAMWPDSNGGALPGISFAPEAAANETLTPIQSPEPVQYKSKWGNWANIPAPTAVHYNQGVLVSTYLINWVGWVGNGWGYPQDVGEPYSDDGGNWRYDLGEPFTDLNGNGRWDGRMTPFVDPISGVLTFSRQSVETSPFPDPVRPWAQTLLPGPAANVFQVNVGGRWDPLSGQIVFNNQRGRFKVVAGTERVFVMSISNPTDFREYRRTLGHPWPGEYRIDYNTGVIEFNDLNPPNLTDPLDPAELLVEYQYRDNFTWDPQSEAYVDDQIVLSYATRSQLRLNMNLAVYDPTSKAPQILTLSRTVGTKNPI